MERFFLFLYDFFRNKRVLFFAIVLAIGLVALYLASRIRFEEDINKMISGVDKRSEISKVIEQSKFLDKIIVTVSMADTGIIPDPEKLILTAEKLSDTLQSALFQPYVSGITFRLSESLMEDMFDIVYSNLPVFLEESDYYILDTLVTPEKIQEAMSNSYNTLLSPASFALKKMIVRDPVGLSSIALRKLGAFQNDDNYRIIDGCIFSKDKRHLLLFLTNAFPSNATSKNTLFVKNLDKVIETIVDESENTIAVEYFGSAVVAVGNAERLKKDIRLTLSITTILLLLIINFSIRKKKLFPFIFLPAVFGGLAGLAVIYLIQAKISIISLSIGTVILAITVDYSLHITTHYKHKHSVLTTIKDVSFPIIVCGFATAFEFLSLVFVSSESLHELGILAAVSVITASFFTMVVMPHILDLTKGEKDETEEKNYLERVLDKITHYDFHRNKLLLLFMIILTVVCAIFIDKVGFESDMMKMNYMSNELARAEENLNKINNLKLNSIYIVAHGENLQEALLNNEKLVKKGNRFLHQQRIGSFSSPGSLLYSDSLQQERIDRWNEYWSDNKKETFLTVFNETAMKTGFKTDAFTEFFNLIHKSYRAIDTNDFRRLQAHFFKDNISITAGLTTVVSVIKVNDLNKNPVVAEINDLDGIVVMDRKSILSDMVNLLSRDFNFIANVSLSLILIILIIAFGRFELGFITFLPIFLSWVWTLGIMGMAGIKFNIFNIIISSFITGLGIDYSIYIMQGLVQGYKTSNKNLLSYKTCILISVMISLSGTGVLILAKHPSLNSIALISIIGLLSVVLISYTFEPILFYWLVSKKGRNRLMPMTLSDFLINYIFVLISMTTEILLMHIILLVLLPLPIPLRYKQKALHHSLSGLLKVLTMVPVHIKKKTINPGHEDFKKPSVIISNHQSQLDIVYLLKTSPNIIILTAEWVWNNPTYASVIRFLNFYPVQEGYEALLPKLRKKVDEGYSILVFPEGTRSVDGNIKRFHKGAFLLAEKLNLDIVPVMMHGTRDCFGKGEQYLKGGRITMKIFPRIKLQDKRFGNDYHERTKSILRFYREEYQKLRTELEIPSYFRTRLIRNYIYKGPVLEWYTRIKLSLENNYAYLHDRIPRDAKIVDMGCGYGMISYMLSFTSDQRTLLGIDYDSDKIELANNCISKNDRIHFVAADVTTYDLPHADVFLLSDVLHYIPEDKQEQLLIRCIDQLNPDGIILIRDADKDLQKRHRGTRYSEFFSTRFGFNKAINKKLFFFSGKKITDMAKKYNLQVEIADNTRLTSNLLYILRRVVS
ncbi:MAG: 1-acyl-sn-glycerol-3-phosphate acyltransferase [Bacteroidales bacterium]|nr:1-acyl-sn-glycerol-3-phosphate acyltransferase [Bacteroidales bacterium]